MDKASRKNQQTTYDFTCGDNSSGSITSQNPEEARDHASIACKEKGGVQSGPAARPWPGHQE